jgi:Rieske 2Fe-2S family protein
MFVVAHPDHVRIVSLSPLGVAGTRLTAEWLFAPETLAHEGFDMGNVTEFGALVMTQDAAVCELNQRGLRSIRHEHGRLMPNENDIALFYRWLDRRIGPGSNVAWPREGS